MLLHVGMDWILSGKMGGPGLAIIMLADMHAVHACVLTSHPLIRVLQSRVAGSPTLRAASKRKAECDLMPGRAGAMCPRDRHEIPRSGGQAVFCFISLTAFSRFATNFYLSRYAVLSHRLLITTLGPDAMHFVRHKSMVTTTVVTLRS